MYARRTAETRQKREEQDMKETGIVRGIDQLGRIVLPKELRRCMNINVGDEMEIFVENGRIVLEKYIPGCIFCGSEEKVSIFNDKYVCAACIEKMKQGEE